MRLVLPSKINVLYQSSYLVHKESKPVLQNEGWSLKDMGSPCNPLHLVAESVFPTSNQMHPSASSREDMDADSKRMLVSQRL